MLVPLVAPLHDNVTAPSANVLLTLQEVGAPQAVRQGGIPFEVTTKTDPFFSEANQAHLKRVIQDYESGRAKTITKTMDELEAMADE